MRSVALLAFALAPAVLLAPACTRSGATGWDRDGGGGGAPDLALPSGVTYTKDVAPILAEHCAQCHTAGGIAPFALDTYAKAKDLAPLIAGAAMSRTMPPFYADNSGACRTHVDANWLSGEEIAALDAWQAAGAPEGDPTIAAPTPRGLPRLARTDVVIDQGLDYTPSGDDGDSDLDEIRCFGVSPGHAADGFITGYEVVPGDARVVHHVIVYVPDSVDPAAESAALDEKDPKPGWRCDGGSGIKAHPVALWAPGGGATQFPAGTGLLLPAGRPVVLQIHYNLAVGRYADHTRVNFTIEKSVAQPARIVGIASPVNLAPGQVRVETSGELRSPGAGKVWGVLPHMHQRGLEMQVDVATSQGDACLLRTVNWDFHWQRAYFFTAPVDVGRGDRFSIRCAYSTMTDQAPVRWGEGTGDEMCLNYVYATGM